MTTTTLAIPSYSGHMPECRCGRVPLQATHDRMLATLADTLTGHVVEGFRVYDAHVEDDWRPQADDEVVRVRLLMEDPSPGEPTWPLAQLEALDRTVRERARQIGIPEEVYVRHVALRSAHQTEIPAEIVARARNAAR
jgi:hypothetical protein